MLRFFTNKKTNPAVRRLYDTAVAQARLPIFYQTFGVPDTLDGRFDMIVLHVWPLIDTLRGADGATNADGQALFDTFVDDMEQNLRTIGVSDTAFARKMKAIAQAFYGRLDAYRRAHDDDALALAIARNVLEDEAKASEPHARALTAYALAMQAAAKNAQDLFTEFGYPDPAPIARAHLTEVTP